MGIGWFGDLNEKGFLNDSIFLKLESFVFGDGGSCTQKIRRGSSENELLQPKALRAQGQYAWRDGGQLLSGSVIWRSVQGHGGWSGDGKPEV